MKIHTARQIVSEATGEVAKKVALASGRTVESIQKEAKNTLRKAKKIERERRAEKWQVN